MEAAKFQETVSGSTTTFSVWESKLIWDIEGIENMQYPRQFDLTSIETCMENPHLSKSLFWCLSMTSDPKDKKSTTFAITLRGAETKGIDYCFYEISLGKPGSERTVSDSACKMKPQRGSFIHNRYQDSSQYKLETKITPDAMNFCQIKTMESTLRFTVNIKMHFKPAGKEGFQRFPLAKFSREKWIAGLFNDDRLSDVILRCQGVKFRGHKIVLGQSSVFEKMFTTNMKEARTNEIVISDTDPLGFECFLKSMYGVDFELPIDLQGILQLVNCAEKYDVLPLKASCFEKLAGMLCDENAAELTIAAYQFCTNDGELGEYRKYFRQYCLK